MGKRHDIEGNAPAMPGGQMGDGAEGGVHGSVLAVQVTVLKRRTIQES
jgi:hypothetical protein